MKRCALHEQSVGRSSKTRDSVAHVPVRQRTPDSLGCAASVDSRTLNRSLLLNIATVTVEVTSTPGASLGRITTVSSRITAASVAADTALTVPTLSIATAFKRRKTTVRSTSAPGFDTAPDETSSKTSTTFHDTHPARRTGHTGAATVGLPRGTTDPAGAVARTTVSVPTTGASIGGTGGDAGAVLADLARGAGIPAGATVVGIGLQIRLTTIVQVAIAVAKSCIAANAACAS